MPFNRRGAVQLIVHAVRPHLDIDPQNKPIHEEHIIVEELEKAFDEEPHFAEAFQAMVEAIWDAAQAEARQGNYRQ